MTNEKRQGGCAEWCGLPYKDDRVPYNPNLQGQRADGSSLPWGISDRDGAEQTDPAYCTAACLERAQEKPVKREPVAPWTRSSGGQNCTTGFNWTTRQWDDESHYSGSHAMYTRPAPDGGSGNVAVCEACAERAGVFGPVKWQTADFLGQVFTIPESAMVERQPPGSIEVTPGVFVTPTCAGPLATHGTPVLRVMGPRDRRGSQRSSKRWLCDGCYMIEEAWFEIRTEINDEPDDDEQAESAEPPARIGTVPQVVSVGVGIWASRGMR